MPNLVQGASGLVTPANISSTTPIGAPSPGGGAGTGGLDAAKLAASGSKAPGGAGSTFQGVQVLTPPDGAPKAIVLPDGSTLVPLGRVLPGGGMEPLNDAEVGAALQGVPPGALAAIAGGGAGRPAVTEDLAPGHTIKSNAAPLGNFSPQSFVYNNILFEKFGPADDIDAQNQAAAEKKAGAATLSYIITEEKRKNFAVTKTNTRRVDPTIDADLIKVNPNAVWVMDVEGVEDTGRQRTIPVVMNANGQAYVDPRTYGR